MIAVKPNDHTSLLSVMSGMRDSLVQRTDALQSVHQDLARSIETLNHAREELVSSEKLAALGALVAGVAHELNTPIGNSLMAVSTGVAMTETFGCRGLRAEPPV